MAAQKSKDLDIRICVTELLLADGIPRSDIRHEITLDSSSSGGRADIIVLWRDKIYGIEIKSACDTLERAEQQISRYDLAFDGALIIADARHREAMRGVCYRHLIYNHQPSGIFTAYGDNRIITIFNHFQIWDSRDTSISHMASLLWAREACSAAVMLGLPSDTRCKAIDRLREHGSIATLRPHVINALRTRCLNRWEESFWKAFDAEEANAGSRTDIQTA